MIYKISISVDNTSSYEIADLFTFDDVKVFITNTLIQYPTGLVVINDGTGLAATVHTKDVYQCKYNTSTVHDFKISLSTTDCDIFTQIEQLFTTKRPQYKRPINVIPHALFYTYFDINPADGKDIDWHGIEIYINKELNILKLCSITSQVNNRYNVNYHPQIDETLLILTIKKSDTDNKYIFNHNKISVESEYLTEIIGLGCFYMLDVLFHQNQYTKLKCEFKPEQINNMAKLANFTWFKDAILGLKFNNFKSVNWRVLRGFMSSMTHYIRDGEKNETL